MTSLEVVALPSPRDPYPRGAWFEALADWEERSIPGAGSVGSRADWGAGCLMRRPGIVPDGHELREAQDGC